MEKEHIEVRIKSLAITQLAQLMCAFDGGTLAQDVSNHMAGHNIITYKGEIFSAPANHHQMMLPAREAEVLAWAGCMPDGKRRVEHYIGEGEVIETLPNRFHEPEAVFFPKMKGIGFQFHPEWDNKHSLSVKWCLDIIKEKLL